MTTAKKLLIDEISQLLELSSSFKERIVGNNENFIPVDLYDDLLFFSTRCKHIFISVSHREFSSMVEKFEMAHVSLRRDRNRNLYVEYLEIAGALKVVKKELENNLLYRIEELIKAEVFADFLEYAKYLINNKHKDAAAVITGSVLENELRNLSNKNNLPTIKNDGKQMTMEPMNENLVKAGVYNAVVKSQITAYGTIRNKAAHGEYDEYTLSQVEKMHQFVVDFYILMQD